MNEPHWLPLEALNAIHETLLSRHGGPSGTREPGLLESALNQPLQLFHYEKADLFQLAASYAHGIVKNHPFVDGNKRTGFMAAYTFLRINGYHLTAPEVEAVTHTLGLAASAITQDDYAAWLEKSCSQ